MQQEHGAIDAMVQMEGYLAVLSKALKYDCRGEWAAQVQGYAVVVEQMQVLLSMAMEEVQAMQRVEDRSKGRASAR